MDDGSAKAAKLDGISTRVTLDNSCLKIYDLDALLLRRQQYPLKFLVGTVIL